MRGSCLKKPLHKAALLTLGLASALAAAWVSASETASYGDRASTLSEMKRRRIAAADAEDFTADDTTLLMRVREAQALGAFTLLREKLATLKGFAIETRTPEGKKDVWLTLEGYRRYIFLKSQTARYYFETHGTEAKDVFRLKDLRGKHLFDPRGMLTQEGDAVYNQVQRGLPTWWRHPDGKVGGATRPPPELLPKPGQAPERPSAPALMEDGEAQKKAAELKATGFVEITEAEAKYLIAVTKRTEAELQKETSLQVVRSRHFVYYLMAPSDPTFALVVRFRAGAPGGSPQNALPVEGAPAGK